MQRLLGRVQEEMRSKPSARIETFGLRSKRVSVREPGGILMVKGGKGERVDCLYFGRPLKSTILAEILRK